MKTDTVPAHTIEKGDLILFSEEVVTVVEANDAEQVILTLRDEDGMCETLPFDPFYPITIYLGEDDVEFEDVEADPD